MKKWIAPLIFLLMIVVPITWALVSAYHDNHHHPEKNYISREDVIMLKDMMYRVDTAKYMPQIRWIRSLSDSALFEILRSGDITEKDK